MPTNLVPNTVADFLPPKTTNLVTEAANFMRAHWDEIKPYYESMSGQTDSMHGSFAYDEAACVFKVQEIAKNNGFAMLGNIKAATLKKVLRFGYKRNTGNPVKLLRNEYKQARLASS